MKNVEKLRKNGWLDTKLENSDTKIVINLKRCKAVMENRRGKATILYDSYNPIDAEVDFNVVTDLISEMK